MNFENDIREYIKSEFSNLRINYKFTGDLGKDLTNLFTIYKKYIYQLPRKVQLSKELQARIENKEKHYNIILHLKKLLEKGEDTNRHQSTKLFNHYVNDYLIYDWNIYHFHLSTKRTKHEYFNDRTKKILFAYVDKEKALFIDIDKHPPKDVFADKRLLEIIDNNWQGILNEANEIIDISKHLNTSERFLFRKKGVNEGLIKVNGKIVFSPGLGVVTSGRSVDVSLRVSEFYSWMRINEKTIKENKKSVEQLLKNKHDINNEIDFKLKFTENGPGIWDSKSGKRIVKYKELIKIE
jgi:hypothetical protein